LPPSATEQSTKKSKKLLDIGSVREVHYPDWLANVVVVRKKNGKWRVCIDFTDLNKACPKDSFPLPHIDMLVDATAGHELLSFMDAFSGYNQILMHPDDQEKTAFITEKGDLLLQGHALRPKERRCNLPKVGQQDFRRLLG